MLRSRCRACQLLKRVAPGQQVYADRTVRVLLARGADGVRELYVIPVAHLDDADEAIASATARHVRKVATWAHTAMGEAGFAFALEKAQMDNADDAGHPHLRLRAATRNEHSGVHRLPDTGVKRLVPAS